MYETDKLLRKVEKVIWSDKPLKSPFMIGGFIASVFRLVWLSFSLFAMWVSTIQGIETFVTLFLSLFVLIGFGLTLGPPIWQVMRYKNTKYLITNQRLITQTGAIGVDTRFLDLDNIQEVYVNVNFVESLWNRNTNRSDSQLSLYWRNISSHYRVKRAL